MQFSRYKARYNPPSPAHAAGAAGEQANAKAKSVPGRARGGSDAAHEQEAKVQRHPEDEEVGRRGGKAAMAATRSPASSEQARQMQQQQQEQQEQQREQERERDRRDVAPQATPGKPVEQPGGAPSQAEWTGIENVLLKHFLFAGTEASKIRRVAAEMTLVTPRPGQVIVREGDVGDSMYVVEQGELHVKSSNTGPDAVDRLGPGRVFGELAVLYDSPRAATVTAHLPGTRIWCLKREVLRKMEGTFMEEKLEKRADILRSIPEFKEFPEDKVRRLASTMQEEIFDAGTAICSEGECLITGVNDSFYVIAEGSADVFVTVAAEAPVRVDEELNEINPTLNGPIPSNDVGALINRAKFVSEVVSKTRRRPSISSVSSNNDHEDEDENDEQNSSDDAEDSEDLLPIAPPLPGPTQKKVTTMHKAQWFGEMALISNEPRTATVIAAERTVCLTLTRSAFVQIVSGTTRVYKDLTHKAEMKKQDNHEAICRSSRNDLASKMNALSCLKVQHVIGEGAFSVVRVATIKGTDSQAFALKTMNKQDLVDRNQVMHVNNERSILEQSSHPFILSLIRTFQTPNHIYMLLELVQGGELFSQVIDSKGGLPPRSVKFYASCILEGLSYLHRKFIAYRDLKLENLIISSEGYVKIIDFGFAKRIEPGTMSNTLCGTPDYLAPEAVMRKGHNHTVDCWALGVLMFEMLTQFSPFADPSGEANQMVVFKRIIHGPDCVDWRLLQRAFANESQDEAYFMRTTLLRLWEANPHDRVPLINLKDGDDPARLFFQDIDFTNLRQQTIPPPWKPNVKSASDTSYFDTDAFTESREPHTLFKPQTPEIAHAFDDF
ncbi:Protein kinase, putative [Hondaea fermentalgiana]|uniref:cGMP-dependent protein kinase n=1 Tax=Hondaea fermentalgiana TaxID=2315210 RepID=A0A2R5G9I0_9STRA|nr:Protein kinase, putative [Hondaea fermentalgiana]|eukprot:GBG26969.1 Protein kinase, putative [Hondaea fermentalgiana]